MKLLRGFLIGVAYVVLLIPLVYYTGFTSSYVFSQVSLLHILALASFAPLIVLWYYDEQSRPVYTRLLFIPLAFFCSLVLSAIIGVNQLKSFLGVWERFGSIVDWAAALWYGLLLISLFKSKQEWWYYFRAASIVATLEAVFALLQLSPVSLVYTSGARVYGTTGNPAFLAGYLLVALGITFSLRMSARRSGRIAYDLSIILQCLALILTQARAALIGPVIAIICYTVLIGRYHRERIRSTLRAFGILVCSAALIAWGIQATKHIDVTHVTQSLLRGETSQSRILIWKAAVQGFLDEPLFGVGEGNFIVVFQRHYDPRIYRGQEDSTWFDRSHNEILDRLTLGGIVGCIAYILLLFVLPFMLIRRPDASHERALSSLSLVPWIMAYATYLIFFFHSIADTLLWITSLAYLVASGSIQNRDESREGKKSRFFSIGALVLSAGLIVIYLAVPVRANLAMREGMRAKTIEDALPFYRSAWDLDIRSRRGIVSDMFDRIAYRPEDPALEVQHILQLQKWAEEVVGMYPFELQYQRPLIFAYRNRVDDVSYLSHAIDLAGVGVLLSPMHPEPYILRGVTELDAAAASDDASLKLQRMADARKDFAEAHRLSPEAHDTSILFLATTNESDQSLDSLEGYIHENAESMKVTDWILTAQIGMYYGNKGFVESVKNELEKLELRDPLRFAPVREYVERMLEDR